MQAAGDRVGPAESRCGVRRRDTFVAGYAYRHARCAKGELGQTGRRRWLDTP